MKSGRGAPEERAPQEPSAERFERFDPVRGAVLIFGALLSIFFGFVVVQRFRYPVELEWMTGSILDHVERVQQGKPVYTAPSADWIPFLYPPLYYWVSALVARVCALWVACRVVSVGATLASAALIGALARTLGASRFWIFAAVACFFGAYSYSGYWYDIERCDMLVVALLLGGAWLMIAREKAAFSALAGGIIGLAFYAKQPASLFLLFGILAFIVLREWKRAVAFAIGGVVGIVPLFVYLHVSTDGWFDYYCLKMPGAHGMLAKLITVFFILDLSNAFALTGATVTLFALVGRDLWTRVRLPGGQPSPHRFPREHVVFTFLLAAGFLASMSSRLHFGGWPNVLVFWTSFACIAIAVVGSRLDAAARHEGQFKATGTILAAFVLLQLAHFAYDPSEVSPDARNVASASEANARVARLEAAGPVLLTTRGHVTTPRHFGAAALQDVLRAGGSIPDDLARGIRQRDYAAYVIGDFTELSLDFLLGKTSDLFPLVTANYYVAERWDDRDLPPLVGWTGQPQWVLRPRKTPLPEGDIAFLKRRQHIEKALADMQMQIAQSQTNTPPLDIESRAAEIDHRTP